MDVVELNKGRVEARHLWRFDVTPEQVGFPAAAQAAHVLRASDRPDKKSDKLEDEFLITSHPCLAWSAQVLHKADRDYWGIESGLHHRLDVSALEDKSRVRHPTAAWNLALFRRAANSFAVYWIQRVPGTRQATLRDFYDNMRAKGARKAFSIVTVKNPSWLRKM